MNILKKFVFDDTIYQVNIFNKNKLYNANFFRPKEIGLILDIKNVMDVTWNLYGKVTKSCNINGKVEKVTLLTKRGVLELIFYSKTEIAESFMGWLLDTIDEIRKDNLKNKFVYNNSLGREYDKSINKIVFSISRYGKYKHTINFDKFVTEKKAIKSAESYLSEPLTKDYYDKIRDDLFVNVKTEYEEACKDYNYICRGHCLSDAIYLEESKRVENTIFLLCGS